MYTRIHTYTCICIHIYMCVCVERERELSFMNTHFFGVLESNISTVHYNLVQRPIIYEFFLYQQPGNNYYVYVIRGFQFIH